LMSLKLLHLDVPPGLHLVARVADPICCTALVRKWHERAVPDAHHQCRMTEVKQT
jgi:hypothetical protein